MLLRGGHFPYRKSGSLNFDHGGALAQAIVDTVREPLLALDQDLRVVAASRSFYLTFRTRRQDTVGRLLHDLGEGQWDIPELCALLEKVVPEQAELAVPRASRPSSTRGCRAAHAPSELWMRATRALG